MLCVNKQFCYSHLKCTRRVLVHAFFFKTVTTAADPREERMGYPTPSGADVWEEGDFLEMHIHCSCFVLPSKLSKDLACVKMHCSLFAKVCCYSPLLTDCATLPRPPRNNLNFPLRCQPGLAECHQWSMPLPWILCSPLLVARAQQRSVLAG